MYSFGSFLQDLSLATKISFNLRGVDGSPIYISDENAEDSKRVHFSVSLGNTRANIDISKSQEICIPLLKYTIENKYRELFSLREQILADLLEGKEVSKDKLYKNLPKLSKGCTLFLVSVDGSRYEALNIIRESYSDQDVLTMLYEDNIIIIGYFEEINEHAKSIKDAIVSDLYCKCKVSYGNIIFDIDGIRKAYNESKECILLGKTFGIKDEIFNYNKILFEKIVYNIDSKVKSELLNNFSLKFKNFDSEIIGTIEEFVNCGLNISDTARKLYVHRNTLIYRLDKINKETGFDIRNFREATVFIIAFLVWKEYNNKR